MKYAREIKVGALSLVCLFLLVFGFHFLKGVNIFSPVYEYHGKFVQMNGLKAQAPVYIRGFKVGQVDQIMYDFTLDTAFLVDISVDKHIALPRGTQMAIISDGMLGGMAVELQLPAYVATDPMCVNGEYLPTLIVPGLMDNLQNGLLASLTETIDNVNGVVKHLGEQLEGDHISSVLTNVDKISGDLTTTSADLKRLMHTRVPEVVDHVDSVVGNLDVLTASLRDADIVGKVDTAVTDVKAIIADVRSQDGTLGKLIYDPSLYTNVNATIVSADSLLVDLKANPKRYVHFSLFGAKDKKEKNKK